MYVELELAASEPGFKQDFPAPHVKPSEKAYAGTAGQVRGIPDILIQHIK
jgi:hypothetical protein